MEVRCQDEAEGVTVRTNSDWGGNRWNRKSTSGGEITMGRHCIKTWSTTQGAVALSSAEAEFYAMVDGVTKGKWMVTVAKELGFREMRTEVVLGTDSSAAKRFVSRRVLGRMRHIEMMDLWLKEEVKKGTVKVEKVIEATKIPLI